MKKKSLDYVSINNAAKDSKGALAVLGGMIAGRFVSKQLDKVFDSPAVQGIELAASTAKFVKPGIIALSGVAIYQIGKGKNNDIIKMGGLGFAATGFADLSSVVLNKPILSGIEDDPGYRVIDIETTLPISGTGEILELPELSENYASNEDFGELNGHEDGYEFELAN